MSAPEKSSSSKVGWKRKLFAWGNLTAVMLLSAYFAVFMQWLYETARPSFMDSLPLPTRLGVMLLSGLALFVLALLPSLVLMAASLMPWPGRAWRIFLWAALIFPAFLLAVTALSMIDNFTYTLFRFGIITSQGIVRGVYAALFAVLLVLIYRWLFRSQNRLARKARAVSALKPRAIFSGVLLVLTVLFGTGLVTAARPTTSVPVTGQAVRTPNILLIGTDALEDSHMSVYGYKRPTTPFLETFAKQALVSTNNFPNVSISAGSFASIFTGKLPTTTRVLFPPDTLKGANAVQHFPGILEDNGYYTAEMSVDYYADATQYNLQDGFYMVNNRSVTSPVFYGLARSILPEDVNYFLSTKTKQLGDRLLHIFFIQKMDDPLGVVYQGLETVSDQERIDTTLDIFRTAQQPVFVHDYLLDTHSGILKSSQPVFSKGKTLNNDTLTDFYDDAVLSFDRYMQQVVAALKDMGQLDQTIIIVYSDHGWNDVSNVRLPLLIRFPNGEHAGVYNNNTQNLDIAPTILNYMGLPVPAWMQGSSLLQGEPPANRPIFSAVPNFTFLNSLNQLQIDPKKTKPPFYQFGTIGMAICQEWYSLDTSSLTFHVQEIADYHNPCDPSSLPDDSQAMQMIVDRLKADGFDVSSLTTNQELFKATP